MASFKGTAVEWEGQRFEISGMAEVSIDGKKVDTIDQYSYNGVHVGRMDQREVTFRWSRSGLTKGQHTIKVRILPQKNPNSRGTDINIRGLNFYP